MRFSKNAIFESVHPIARLYEVLLMMQNSGQKHVWLVRNHTPPLPTIKKTQPMISGKIFGGLSFLSWKSGSYKGEI